MISRNDIDSLIYTVALSLGLAGYYFLTTMFRVDYSGFFYETITISVVLLLIRLFFFSGINLQELLIFCVLATVFFIVYVYNGDNKLLFLLVFIFASKGIDYKKILKIYCYTVLFCTIVTIFSALAGKIPNLIYFRNGIKREAYGSIYPTNFAAHIFYLVLAYVTLKKWNLNSFEKVAIIGIAYIIMEKCDARLDGYLLIMMLIALVLKKSVFKIVVKFGKTLIPYSMGILIILAIYFSYNFSPNSTWGFILNNIFNNRLSQGHLAFMRYPIKLFGQHISMQGMGGLSGMYHTYNEYFYIDNSYIQILLISGLLAFVIIVCAYLYLFIDYVKRGYIFLVISFVFIGISSMIDEQFLMVSYNIFLLSLMADKSEFVMKVNNKEKL
ncbi:hypothetical protein AALT52_00375 [Ligilactobacillus faecis]|uniref:Polysaccharide polymerase n=1 Tax=Ligilactobacillus faecis TaxID=762833 RepID=A0ABV4DPP2_9LACO